jgi:outer membrane receptor protein involved in Fe transport
MKAHCLIAASVIAIIAHANTARAADAVAPEEQAIPADGPTSDDIIVTARRREERLNDVPVAVTALNNDTLKAAQVATPKELSQFVPSLNVNTGNTREGNRFTLRGQGATLAAGEAVVTYLAEAPVPYLAAGAAGMIFDLENVQVLNGPQGTLFGRNTTGGAVLFTPRAPRDENGLVDGARVTRDKSASSGGPIDEITFRCTGRGGPSLTLIKFLDRSSPPLGETILGFHTADIDALVERARLAGGALARPICDIPDHGVRVGFVADPEGHLIEVVSRLNWPEA